MITYFLNNNQALLGVASTHLQKGFRIVSDDLHSDVDTGHATFEVEILFKPEEREELENMTNAGNYILRNDSSFKDRYSVHSDASAFTIIEQTVDPKEKTIRIYAEDVGLTLLNEVAPAISPTEPKDVTWYLEQSLRGTGVSVRKYDFDDTIMVSFDGGGTVSEQVYDIISAFDAEIVYGFDVLGLQIAGRWVDIYKNRGQDTKENISINREVDNIVVVKSVANMVTALDANGTNDVNLVGYQIPSGKDDNGDLIITTDGYLVSQKAALEWINTGSADGYYHRSVSFDASVQATLFDKAKEHLKKYCKPEENYEVTLGDVNLNFELGLGDRVNVIDDSGKVYISGRVLEKNESVCDGSKTITLGEFLIKSSGISEQVADLYLGMTDNQKKTAVLKERILSTETSVSEVQEHVVTLDEMAEKAASDIVIIDQAMVQIRADLVEAEEAIVVIRADLVEAEEAIVVIREDLQIAEQAASEAQAAAEAAIEANYKLYNILSLTDTQIQTLTVHGYYGTWARHVPQAGEGTHYYLGAIKQKDILLIYIEQKNHGNKIAKLLVEADKDYAQGVNVKGTVISYDENIQAYFWHDSLGAHVRDITSGCKTDLTGSGFKIYQNSVELAHLGYGSTKSEAGTTINAQYYSLGQRKASTTIGQLSVSEGIDTEASGAMAHAEGALTTASGNSSHAEGTHTGASGNSSHAEGDNCLASGNYSHAEGYHTEAGGNGSHAEGTRTVAMYDNQHVEGRYNVMMSSSIAHVIGCGTSTSDADNAMCVSWSGNGYFKGNVYVRGTESGRTSGGAKLADVNITTLHNVQLQEGFTSSWSSDGLCRINESIGLHELELGFSYRPPSNVAAGVPIYAAKLPSSMYPSGAFALTVVSIYSQSATREWSGWVTTNGEVYIRSTTALTGGSSYASLRVHGMWFD